MEDKNAELMGMLNGGGGVMNMEAVSDDGYDKTADSREAPEVKIDKIFARLGSIVVIGLENDQQVEKQITIDEAMLRCRALIEMVKTPWKYRSDLKVTRNILQMFITAVETAKNQLGAAGFAHGVQM